MRCANSSDVKISHQQLHQMIHRAQNSWKKNALTLSPTLTASTTMLNRAAAVAANLKKFMVGQLVP
jgi:hypothetical protein